MLLIRSQCCSDIDTEFLSKNPFDQHAAGIRIIANPLKYISPALSRCTYERPGNCSPWQFHQNRPIQPRPPRGEENFTLKVWPSGVRGNTRKP